MGLIKRYELGRIEVAFIIIIMFAAIGVGLYSWKAGRDNEKSINSYADCVAAGNEVMDSFPEQCAANGQTFVNVTNFEQCKAAGFAIQESYPERCSANGQTWSNPDQEVDEQPYGEDGLDGTP